MRPSLASIRVVLVGASVVTAAFIGCAKGATLGTGPGGVGGDGGDGGDGGGDTIAHQGGSGNGTGGAGPSTTTSSMTTSTTSTTTTTTTTTTSTTTTTTSTSTTATTTTTGGGGVCDGTGDCQTCADCAGLDACFIEYFICSSDIECIDYANCISLCASNDDACFAACDAQYPFGSQEYYDYAYCVVCFACYGDCDGAGAGC